MPHGSDTRIRIQKRTLEVWENALTKEIGREHPSKDRLVWLKGEIRKAITRKLSSTHLRSSKAPIE